MTAMRRSVSVSLVLSMLLVAGTASAAPIKGESVFKSFGKAVSAGMRVGKAEFGQRREKAGPGLVARTMTKLRLKAIGAGVGVAMMSIHVKDSAVALGGRVKERTLDAGHAIARGTRATGAAIAADWRQTKEDFKGGISAIKIGTGRMVSTLAAKRAARVERRAAEKDFKAWLGEKGNESLKTFHVGASKEAGLGEKRAARAVFAGATVVNAAGTAVIGPLGAAGAGAGLVLTKVANTAIKDTKMAVATRTLEHAISSGSASLDSARVARWAKAGILVDPTAP